MKAELDILETFRDINVSGSATLPENPLVGVIHWCSDFAKVEKDG